MSFVYRVALFALVLALVVPGVSGARTPRSAVRPVQASPSPSALQPSATGRTFLLLPAGGGTEPYAAFVRGAERQIGLIDILRKDDETYLELGPEQLAKTYVLAATLASGVGDGAFAGRVYPPLLIRFERVGKRILWIEPNARFVAAPGAEAAREISVADSIVAASPIVAENVSDHRVVINANHLLTDLEGIGKTLGRASPGPALPGLFTLAVRPAFTLDPARSFVVRTKALPADDEILVNLTFAGPPGALATVPDSHGVPLRVHYSLIEAPHDGYVPRLADDRVGYFLTEHKRLGDAGGGTPIVRYIDRIDLSHGPRVFYLTREIPTQYRDAIRRGLLSWNAAFAKIGIPDAIEVRDAPDDPAWDPDDVRHSVVRWITSDRPDFGGVSTSLVDPRTGEILRSEIVIEGEAVRAIKRGYLQVIAPMQRGAAVAPAAACPDDDCAFAWNFAAHASLGTLLMRLTAHPTPAQLDRYTQDFVTALAVHETGHALGLSHNFEGSAAYAFAKLQDPAFTAARGISASVMDYNGINLAPAGKPQGAYFQTRPGVYDDWAIAYGSTPVVPGVKEPQAELPALRRIADRSTRPELAFASDDDASGTGALDPRVAPFDLSSDPLAFAAQSLSIANGLVARLDRLSIDDASSYADERAAFLTIMEGCNDAAFDAARYLGGMYESRAHRGQSGGGPPFRAIPRAVQRRAFDLIAAHVFSAHAFALTPKLINDLGYERFPDAAPARPDFPIGLYVQSVQDALLGRLFAPLTLSRLSDQEQRARPGTTMSLADLFEWTRKAIWEPGFAGGRIPPAHRTVQRSFTDLMAQIALLPTSGLDQLQVPSDAQALPRHELQAIAATVAADLRAPRLDLETRAHLQTISVRVRRTLNAGALQQL